MVPKNALLNCFPYNFFLKLSNSNLFFYTTAVFDLIRQFLREIHYSIGNRLIGLVGRVFASGPRYRGSIPGRVMPKTLKMVLDNSLLNPQDYKVRIKDKVEQSWERSSALLYTTVLKREPSGRPRLLSLTLVLLIG